MRVEAWQRNFAALWIAQLLSMVAFSFVFPFIPLYVRTLGVTSTVAAAQWAALIGAASAVSMAVAQPIWGHLADRWGRKPMVIRSMIGGSIIVTLMGLATSPEQLVMLRFIQGGVTGVVAAATALVATSTPKQRLGFALGAMQVALFLGTSIGPLVGGIIADQLGFRAAFYAAGALMAIGGVIVVTSVRESFTPTTSHTARGSILGANLSLFSIPTFPVLVGIVFLIQLSNVVISPVLSLFIAELSGDAGAATAAGIVIAATGAASAISAMVLGRLGDRIGHGFVLSVCLVGAFVAYIPQALVGEVWQLLGLRIILGAFVGGLMPSANTLVAELIPSERRGAAYGLTATASAMANGVGPIAGAGLATQWGMRSVFLATGTLFALAWIWTRLGFRGHPLDRLEMQPHQSHQGDHRSG